jgi:hypothetical protein
MLIGRQCIDLRAAVAAVVAACAIGGTHAADAHAYDAFPCGGQHRVKWSAEPVQLCPLAGLVDGNRAPLYTNPVPNPRGRTIPAPRIWVGASNGVARFICESRFPNAEYYHPRGWRNFWWAKTIGSDGKPGWVPEVFFKGGDGDESDLGLRTCENPKPPPPPPPPVGPCEPTPDNPDLRMRVRFARGGQVATTRYGRGPAIRGSLTSANGAPVAGAAICVGAQDRADGPLNPIGSVATDAAGNFAYEPAKGASRRLCFVHRNGGGAGTDCVDLLVRAPVRLRAGRRALRNGQATVFRGRVGGASDTRGLLVELQYPQRRRWQTFATVQVGRKGRFRYRYRFTRTVGDRIYRLRARVPAQRGYPFAAGRSRTVRVRVVG